MARARVRQLGAAADLLRSDWERVIFEANLGVENTKIATMYLLDAIPQIEIAVEIGVDRSTISKRLPKILDRVERTAHKLNLC